jgi:hypothetical protein
MIQRNPRMEELNITNVDFDDPALYEHLNDPDHENNENILKILFLLAVCHTVIVDHHTAKPYFNSSSPDELADDDNNIIIEMRDGT